MVSGYNPDVSFQVGTPFLVSRGLEIYGSRACGRNDLKETIDLVNSSKEKPIVAESYPLTEANAALNKLERGDLVGPTSYGHYPDIQALWEQYQKESRPNVRKDLITRVQKFISEKTLWIPLTEVTSPAALGPRVKGNPYKIQPLLWFTAPFEDIELER